VASRIEPDSSRPSSNDPRALQTAARTGPGYNGLIVRLTYYVLDYNDPASVGGAMLLNDAMKTAANHDGVLVASGFDAWKANALASGGGHLRRRATDRASNGWM
jgi:hypothetical protein